MVNNMKLAEDLLRQGMLSMELEDGELIFYVNCNDTFSHATKDAEDITLDELPELAQSYEECPVYGGILWVCRKRRQKPLKEILDFIPPKYRRLFESCDNPPSKQQAPPQEMYAVQFSKDGSKFCTIIKLDNKKLAESVMKALAGYGQAFGHPYWQVREVDQSSKDFHATIEKK